MINERQYMEQPKLNKKKVIAVIVVIIAIIMFGVSIKRLLFNNNGKGDVAIASYYPVYTNGKWGVINSVGNMVINAEYDEMITIPDNKEDVFICTYDVDYENNTYKTKVLNSKAKEIFTEYELVEPIYNYDEQNNMWYQKNVLKVKKNGLYGLINLSGKKLVECTYDNIKTIVGIENSIILTKDAKVGVCDQEGNIIIDVQYKQIRAVGDDYKNGYIVVDEENKYGVVGFDKKVVLETRYEDIKPVYGDGKYVVKQNDIYSIINKSGVVLSTVAFDEIKSINTDWVIFVKDNKYGVMDKNGTQKIANQYEDLKYAYGDYFIAKRGGKYGIINISEEIKLGFGYSNINYRKDAGFIEVERENDTSTYIYDNEFNFRLSGIISEVNTSKGYMKLRVENEYKYYNFKFEEKIAQDILGTNNLFLSKKDGKYGYVDKDGNVVVTYIYDDATEQNSFGYMAVKKDGLWGSIDKDGRLVVEPKYKLENNVKIDFIGKWHIGEDLNSYYYTDM